MRRLIIGETCEIVIFHQISNTHGVEDNLDVNIIFADGRRYLATFFTLNNLHALMEKNKRTGECAGGLYLYAVNMILLETLSDEAIITTVKDLIANGELDSACSLAEEDDQFWIKPSR